MKTEVSYKPEWATGEIRGLYVFDSDIHCIMCGTKGVWTGGGDDYYLGESSVCTSCGSSFTWQGSGIEPGSLIDSLKEHQNGANRSV